MLRNLIALCLLLLTLSVAGQSFNSQAALSLNLAIKLAILDGLSTVDIYVRTNYWYYLQGAERLSFNVTIKPASLNYIMVYQYHSNLFRVNIDLDKV